MTPCSQQDRAGTLDCGLCPACGCIDANNEESLARGLWSAEQAEAARHRTGFAVEPHDVGDDRCARLPIAGDGHVSDGGGRACRGESEQRLSQKRHTEGHRRTCTPRRQRGPLE
eukprot:1930826-Rhodomonas_salina.2